MCLEVLEIDWVVFFLKAVETWCNCFLKLAMT